VSKEKGPAQVRIFQRTGESASVSKMENSSKTKGASSALPKESVDSSAKSEEATCRVYLGRDIKCRFAPSRVVNSDFGPKTEWLSGKVTSIVKGGKWGSTSEGASGQEAADRWWVLRVICETGQKVDVAPSTLLGRGKTTPSQVRIKLVPLEENDPRLMQEKALKEEKQKATEAARLEANQRFEAEQQWLQTNAGKLTWPYLHEPPARFQGNFLKAENHHHMLAWLEASSWEAIQKQVSMSALNLMHGESCKDLASSHKQALKWLNARRTSKLSNWTSMVHNAASYAILDHKK